VRVLHFYFIYPEAMRTVLITGASRGIGLGLVRGFLNTAGTQVIATARRPDLAVELAALLKAGAARYSKLADAVRIWFLFHLTTCF
jgi:NAD(P)-dependent dehydrogenase (short-subunit alcohol dehydrogenase family)